MSHRGLSDLSRRRVTPESDEANYDEKEGFDMSMGKLAVIGVALGLAFGGLGAAVADSWRPDDDVDPIALDARRNDMGDDVAAAADEEDGDGDSTRGNHGTRNGNNTG